MSGVLVDGFSGGAWARTLPLARNTTMSSKPNRFDFRNRTSPRDFCLLTGKYNHMPTTTAAIASLASQGRTRDRDFCWRIRNPSLRGIVIARSQRYLGVRQPKVSDED